MNFSQDPHNQSRIKVKAPVQDQEFMQFKKNKKPTDFSLAFMDDLLMQTDIKIQLNDLSQHSHFNSVQKQLSLKAEQKALKFGRNKLLSKQLFVNQLFKKIIELPKQNKIDQLAYDQQQQNKKWQAINNKTKSEFNKSTQNSRQSVTASDIQKQIGSINVQYKPQFTFWEVVFSSCIGAERKKKRQKRFLQIQSYAKLDLTAQAVNTFEMLERIYYLLTNKLSPANSGSHWQTIGFQGSEPNSDLRSVGLFGVYQILKFVQNNPTQTHQLYSLSCQGEGFPLCATLLNFSLHILTQLKEGIIQCEEEQQVLNLMNVTFLQIVVSFLSEYKKSGRRIGEIGKCIRRALKR